MSKEVRHTMTAAEAARTLGIPAGSIRAWASSKRLWSFESDERGRPLYDRDHLIELRDKTRRRAPGAHRRRAPRPPKISKEFLDRLRDAF